MLEINNCSGCGSCAAACPQTCIAMTSDGEGFRYPAVDPDRCIQCGRCEKVCPILNQPSVSTESTAVAAQNADDAIRLESSSGGVFSALAADVLRRGGKVCAAVYDSDFSVRHVIADSMAQLEEMRGAKYTQSQAEHCFPEIRQLLRSGTPVLFVGTPCQTAGLRSYLRKNDGNLLVADMICHGVSSPVVWHRYLRERQNTDAPGSVLQSVNLRSKSTGWSRYRYSVQLRYADGTVCSVPQSQDAFMRGFVTNLYLRPSCADCGFKGIERCSDLTLADCWGIWDQHPEFDDDKGTSLLLIHSEAGQAAWERIRSGFRSLELTAEDAVARNPSALHSSQPHPGRGKFFRGLERAESVQTWIHACLEPPKETIMRRLIRKICRK